MIRKSGNRFSEEFMVKKQKRLARDPVQSDRVMI